VVSISSRLPKPLPILYLGSGGQKHTLGGYLSDYLLLLGQQNFPLTTYIYWTNKPGYLFFCSVVSLPALVFLLMPTMLLLIPAAADPPLPHPGRIWRSTTAACPPPPCPGFSCPQRQCLPRLRGAYGWPCSMTWFPQCTACSPARACDGRPRRSHASSAPPLLGVLLPALVAPAPHGPPHRAGPVVWRTPQGPPSPTRLSSQPATASHAPRRC
jgi:hypothetical protein